MKIKKMLALVILTVIFAGESILAAPKLCGTGFGKYQVPTTQLVVEPVIEVEEIPSPDWDYRPSIESVPYFVQLPDKTLWIKSSSNKRYEQLMEVDNIVTMGRTNFFLIDTDTSTDIKNHDLLSAAETRSRYNVNICEVFKDKSPALEFLYSEYMRQTTEYQKRAELLTAGLAASK